MGYSHSWHNVHTLVSHHHTSTFVVYRNHKLHPWEALSHSPLIDSVDVGSHPLKVVVPGLRKHSLTVLLAFHRCPTLIYDHFLSFVDAMMNRGQRGPSCLLGIHLPPLRGLEFQMISSHTVAPGQPCRMPVPVAPIPGKHQCWDP